ncbi:MAG: 3-methyl-2-oxobutanoate dehydrogenase subunit VorB [Nitrospirae bacterium]|nr:3-methyl-2-oxobutanoate dehydrogenase subunit VorB [Nitrospirota bacterium]
MKGNDALAEAAIEAGCRFYAGYPITPQNEVPEHMSRRMPEVNGIFIQAESELAAINMVFGASAVGARAMTSSSSPGISLKQEGISYLAGAELPAVIANIQRGGPGLGNISGSQADYFQAVKGGGHGDYRLLVYAPWTVQEMWDLTLRAFDKADEYRNPAMILSDGIVGQIMEPIVCTRYKRPKLPQKDWALTGCAGRKPNVVKSLFMGEGALEEHNLKLKEKYGRMKKTEVLYDSLYLDDAELIVAAYGIAARIASSAVRKLRKEGHKAGLFRPVTLFPFPEKKIADLCNSKRRFLTIEMNLGQMVEDVRLAVNGRAQVDFYGRPGGGVMTTEELYNVISNKIISGQNAMPLRHSPQKSQ